MPPAGHEQTVAIVLIPPRLGYALPGGFPAQGGAVARLGQRPLVAGEEFRLDAAERRVVLQVSFQAGDTLHLTYRTLPISLATVYGEAPSWAAPDSATELAGPLLASLAPVVPAAGSAPQAAPAADAPAGPGGPKLDISGSKSFVVESGALGDATIRQSLDVRASGSLGGGVELAAVLSDRDAPVAAGGGTLDLEEIDQVLIEARHERGVARLGDVTLAQNLGQYGRFERRGSGAHLEANLPGASASGSLAESKGRYHSVRLTGEDARQGPYGLSDESGGTPVAVVSGSETVWLDGQRMSHGESADYSMDYARGALTFTPRRPITAGARISVDFQIAVTAYPRLVSRAAATARRGGFELFGHAFREADDEARPATGSLEDSTEAALQAGGDSPDTALALPTEHALLGGGASWQAGSWLRLEGELAASRFDANSLSGLGDQDNAGSAWRAEVALTPRLQLAGTRLGTLDLSAAAERVEPTFRAAGRTRSPLFTDEWGMGRARTSAGGDSRLVALGYRPVPELLLRGERGKLSTKDGFDSERWRWNGEWAGRFAHRLRVDRAETGDTTSVPGARTRGERDFVAYETEWKARPELVPGFRFTHDALVPTGTGAGERRTGWEASLSGERGGWGWMAGHGRRQDGERPLDEWQDKSHSSEWRGEVRAALSRDASASLGASHRAIDYPNGAATTSDNGSARLAFGSWGARHEAAVEWGAESAPVRLPELRFVGTGAGAYDALGRAAPGGDFAWEYRESADSLQRLSRGRLAYRAEWATGGGYRFATTLQSSTVREGALDGRVFLATPRILGNDESVVAGSFLFRQELRGRAGPAADWTLRVERLGQTNRQTVGYEESQAAWSEDLRLRWQVARGWTWDARLTGAQREGSAVTPLESWARAIDEWGAEITLAHAPREAVTLAARGEWLALVPGETSGVAAASGVRFGPRLTWAIGQRARLEGETLWSPGLETSAWPAVVPSASRAGWERVLGRVDFSYRLRGHGILGFEWLVRALPGEDVVHTARGELRAYF